MKQSQSEMNNMPDGERGKVILVTCHLQGWGLRVGNGFAPGTRLFCVDLPCFCWVLIRNAEHSGLWSVLQTEQVTVNDSVVLR